MNHHDDTTEMRLPACPRDGVAWVQIIDWTRPYLQAAADTASADAVRINRLIPAEVLYVCHACDHTWGHPVPDAWTPPAGWLPDHH